MLFVSTFQFTKLYYILLGCWSLYRTVCAFFNFFFLILLCFMATFYEFSLTFMQVDWLHCIFFLSDKALYKPVLIYKEFKMKIHQRTEFVTNKTNFVKYIHYLPFLSL